VHGESGLKLFSVDEIIILLAVDFFNHLNMLYGTVTEFCTPQEVRLTPLLGSS
jgi:Mob1/phocein family